MIFDYDYTIISIDDRRKAYKEKIRKNMRPREELLLPSVDGRTANAPEMLKRFGIPRQEWTPHQGEFGVWMSNFLRWQFVAQHDRPLIVFEDDAKILPNFNANLQIASEELPDDWDFMSLWVPENQRQDYMYDCTYNVHGYRQIVSPVRKDNLSGYHFGAQHIARAYQGYGLVAMMYSPKGGARLVELARELGVYTPVDLFIYDRSHATWAAKPGERWELNGYAPKPFYVFVEYDWPETTIHNTEHTIM